MAWIFIVRVLAVVGAVAIGYFIYRKIKLEINKGKSEHRMMKRAVEAVRNNGGQITAAELSFEMDIPIDWAEQILGRLVEEGLTTTDVDDSGRLVFEEISTHQPQRGEQPQRSRRMTE